ncbi:MAG: NAD(P)/FAD-dependent oxidoreductase [Gammaproteobacteria bacterium]|nr:NAD(P)/FAD-dependent oxidoreductase [Gammaproteobacteria bacterium]
MTEQCDVLIVGGGPSGSSLAWALRDSGLDILIMDKKSFPRDKVCAGWVTPAVMESLQVDLEDYSSKHVLQPITSFQTSALGDASVQTEYGEVVSYGIRRREFDDYLLQRSGARTLLETPFKSMEREDDHWLVNGEVRAKLVVGAGGHFCPVARQLGTKLGHKEKVVAAQEVEFELNEEQKKQCSLKADEPELYFLKDLSGYAWAFRKGDYINIGLGRDDNHKLSEHVQAFADYLKEQGKLGFDITERFKGHAYLLQPDSSREILEDNVMLIGDAIGLAYAQSGEGIRPAIESSLMAAEIIKEANGDYSKARLEPYRDRLYERYGKPRPGAKSWIPQGFKQFIGRKLLGNTWFSRHVVIDRWFLHRQQAPLQSK